nr:hypothetical protein [Tanacetum cinerariifolium]
MMQLLIFKPKKNHMRHVGKRFVSELELEYERPAFLMFRAIGVCLSLRARRISKIQSNSSSHIVLMHLLFLKSSRTTSMGTCPHGRNHFNEIRPKRKTKSNATWKGSKKFRPLCEDVR